jgi:hypothetical protein
MCIKECGGLNGVITEKHEGKDYDESKYEYIKSELEGIKKSIEDAFCSEDEYNTINRIHDKLNTLLNDENRVKLSIATMDKFDDYMKNVDKLNLMVNEFKGCVSMARASIKEKQGLFDLREDMKAGISMLCDLGDALDERCQETKLHIAKLDGMFFKIDAIYKAVVGDGDREVKKKSCKKKKKGSCAGGLTTIADFPQDLINSMKYI